MRQVHPFIIKIEASIIQSKPEKMSRELIDAFSSQDFNKVRSILDSSKLELNGIDSALTSACKSGILKTLEAIPIEELLEEINTPDSKGAYPLHYAVFSGNVELVEYLLNHQSDVDQLNSDKRTPLIWACHYGHLDIVDLLVKRGAIVNVIDKFKWTPLLKAAWNGNIKIVSILIDNGADLNASNGDGWTALHWASRYGHLEMVKYLVSRGAKVNVCNIAGDSPFLEAAAYGQLEIVKFLLPLCDKELENKKGFNAKDIANENGFMDVFDYLSLVITEKKPIVLPATSNIKSSTTSNIAPREFADLSDIVDLYGEYSAGKINLTSNVTVEPIIQVEKPTLNTTLVTVEKKVPQEEPTTRGRSLSNLIGKASVFGRKSKSKLELQEELPKLPTQVFNAVANASLNELKLLISKNDELKIEEMLKTFKEINSVDIYGWTALHYAAKEGRANIVTALLLSGADKKIKTRNGQTAYDVAQKGKHSIAVLK